MDLPEVGDQVPRRDDPRMRKFGMTILKRMGWKIVGEVPNLPRLIVIGAPHTSNWDGVVAMSAIQAMQIRIHIMGKDSLFKTPGLSHFLRWLGIYPIDRSSPKGVVEQSAAALQASEQFWLGLAPEGTRKKAAKWKNGFYRIAQHAELPILMAGMDFGRKEFRLSELLYPSGNYAADLRQILDWFADAEPCRPEMLSAPLVKQRKGRQAV